MQHCFDTLKRIVDQAPIMKPISPSNGIPIWVICDASTAGVGAYYGQGKTWDTCQPAAFHSRRFTAAQRNYRTHEQELLAIVEALMKFEDKLIGYPINIVTDHQSLQHFPTQTKLSPRQARWSMFLSRFDYTIIYIQGELNTIADAFSRWYYSFEDHDKAPSYRYVSADRRLDPDGEELPTLRWIEIAAYNANISPNHVSYNALNVYNHRVSLEVNAAITRQNAQDMQNRHEDPENERVEVIPAEEDPLAETSTRASVNLYHRISESTDLATIRRANYDDDVNLRHILNDPQQSSDFKVEDGLLRTLNRFKVWVVCVPAKSLHQGRRISEVLINEAHSTVGHMGQARTYGYIQNFF